MAAPAVTAAPAVERALSALAARLRGRVAALLGGGVGGGGGTSVGGDACPPASHAELLARIPAARQGTGPLFVARPESVADVEQCVRCAAELGLSVSVIGGAHTNHCGLGCVVLDMQRLSDVSVDAASRTLTVGAGALASHIQESANRQGLMVPLGTAPTVGMGLILQGGIGHLTRAFGLTLDSLVSAQVVLADGRCVDASERENPDLLWALRGCGPNFGVVTSVTLAARRLQMFAVAARVFAVPEDRAPACALLHAYAERAAALVRDASADAILHYRHDGRLCLGVYDYGLLVAGDDAAPSGVGAGVAAMPHELVQEEEAPEISILDLYEREPYLCEQPRGTLLAPGSSLGFFVRAIFLPAALSPTAAEELISRMREAPNRHCFVHLQHAGGSVGERAPEETAFAARRTEWSVVISASWPLSEDTRLRPPCTAWALEAARALLPGAVGIYGTDLGPEDTEFAPSAFGENAHELRRLKQKWDKGGMFSCGFPLAPS